MVRSKSARAKTGVDAETVLGGQNWVECTRAIRIPDAIVPVEPIFVKQPSVVDVHYYIISVKPGLVIVDFIRLSRGGRGR
jgi:hypothetical protein